MADEQQPLWKFSDQRTVGGHPLDEVASAMQKAVRRCDAEEAIYWCSELDISGFGGYAWRRLRLITSEDVGLAEPFMPAVIAALYDAWVEVTKREKAGGGVGNGALFLTQAVIALSRAPKSRLVDNAVNLFYAHRENVRREVPSWAVDHHTAAGRRLGRRERQVYESSYGLARQTIRDEFLGPSHPWMPAEQVERLAEPHERHPCDEG